MQRSRSSPCRTLAIALASALLLGAGARAAHASIGDTPWADGFGWPGVTGTIYAAIWYQGNLIVGGEFTEIGGTSAGLIARWDGRTWRALGGGLAQTDISKRGIVTDLAIDNGELIAAGSFDVADGNPVSNIARWNGTTWNSMGTGLDAGVQALALYQGRLIAAGEFGAAGLVATDHIAAWDGQSWSALAGGGLDATAISLAVYHNELIVGGIFSQAGSVAVNSIARWDGAAWDSLGAGVVGGVQGTVWALAVSGDTLVAGGSFTLAGGQPASHVAEWDGAQWRQLGSGMDYDVFSLAIYNRALIAGGPFTSAGGVPAEGLARWDGFGWSALPSRTGRTHISVTPTSILTIAVNDTTLIAGGHFDMTPDVSAVGIARWDGHRWFQYGWGLSDEYYVAWTSSFADYSGQLVIGGRLAHSENLPQPSVDLRTWDGVTMDVLEPTVAGFSTPEVSALVVYHDDLIAGGTFTEIGGVPAEHIARWDGVAWHPLGKGLDDSVDALFVFGDQLIAGGSFTASGLVPALHVASWDGSNWTERGGGVDGAVNTLADYGGQLVAGGAFTIAGGVPASRVAQWDGSAWHALGSGTDDWVRSLIAYDGRLIAAGRFTHAGGIAAEHIAAWNGSAWDALGAGIDNEVSALTVFGQDLIAGGAFGLAGGVPASHVARWDGSAWSAFGPGVSGSFGPFSPNVLALHVWNDQLYVGGLFTSAGGKPSFNIARWDSLPPPRPRPSASFALEAAQPNPFQTSASLWFTIATSATVRGGIYDIRGRRVHTIELGTLPPGRHAFNWDGSDAQGRKVSAGIYFARLESGGVSRTVKLALVP